VLHEATNVRQHEEVDARWVLGGGSGARGAKQKGEWRGGGANDLPLPASKSELPGRDYLELALVAVQTAPRPRV